MLSVEWGSPTCLGKEKLFVALVGYSEISAVGFGSWMEILWRILVLVKLKQGLLLQERKVVVVTVVVLVQLHFEIFAKKVE